MRSMPSPKGHHRNGSTIITTEAEDDSIDARTQLRKVEIDHNDNEHRRRPATTTASSSSGANTTKSASSSSTKLRFPRFGMKSPSPKSSSSSSSPSTARRLRSFPLLRNMAMARGGGGGGGHRDVSETEEMTECKSPPPSPPIGNCSSSSTTSASSTAAAAAAAAAEAREDVVIKCTKIVSVQQPLEDRKEGPASEEEQEQEIEHDRDWETSQQLLQTHQPSCCENNSYSCATAILQHSYLEMLCGPNQQQLLETDQEIQQKQPPPSPSKRPIPDDPTVQDSIECVFASQLEEGLPLWSDDEEEGEVSKIESTVRNIYTYDEEPINAPSAAELPSPATLMQSRQKSRTPFLPTAMANALIPSKRRSHPSNNKNVNNDARPPKAPTYSPKREQQPTKKKYQTAKMVHVGTFDPRSNRLLEVAETDQNLMEEDPAVKVASSTTFSSPCRPGKTCLCHSQTAPILPPETWPQGPLLLRPTPNSGMTVHGIRFSGRSDHFWTPAEGGWWMTALYELAGKEPPPMPPNFPSMCSQCCLLPINNGNEPLGESLVVDFETPLFDGSLMLRLRHVDGGATSANPEYVEYNDNKGYFAGLNRRYQVVIRGKFKQEIPMTGLVSGFVMDRPAGRLPPKWIIKGAVKVLSFFAPQLEVQLDGPRPPVTLAPLGSTPQALVVQEVGPHDELPPLDQTIQEPTQAKHSLLHQTYAGNSSLQRARGRKKAFDKLYANKSQDPKTRLGTGATETYYTFEFLQHLVNFQDFSIELGSLLGSIPIAPIMNGQPLPIMAMTKEGHEKLWSFDVWHQGLVKEANEYDARQAAKENE